MKQTTKQQTFSVPGLAAALAALIGLGFYLVTSLTGYLAGSQPDAVLIGCSAAGILLLAVLAFGKVSGGLRDLVVLAAGMTLIASMILFVLARTSLAADLYFIPVNYPASEQTAFNLSVVGIVFYLAAVVVDIAIAFSADGKD